MDPGSSPSPPPGEPLDLGVVRARMEEECEKRTGFSARKWQLDMAIDLLAGKDTLTIAPTGSGKSLTFALIPFVVKSIVWVVAPLNVIQEQQMATFNKWNVKTLCVNASTNLGVESEVSPECIHSASTHFYQKKIKRGEYQIVISSPESYFATNKLRNVVTSEKLADRRHFVIVDEAHVIWAWGGAFRKEYANLGNLRSILFNLSFAAVTATATRAVKESIVQALHLGSTRELEIRNLGNYRDNVRYRVHVMKGGLTSFGEINQFFKSADKVKPSFVFADSVADTVRIADTLRRHLKWEGENAQKIIPYHALRTEAAKRDAIEAFKRGDCLTLVATEALTMGADFRGAALSVQLGATDTVVTHAQRSGRLARGGVDMAESIMMVTPDQHKKALNICAGVQDVKPDDFVDVKEEDDLGGLEDDLGDMLVEDGELEDEPQEDTGIKKTYKSRRMDLDVARFITTKMCRTKVLDEAFENPAHESCYTKGTCDLCVARRARDEAAAEPDARLSQRGAHREELQIIFDEVDLPHKKSKTSRRIGDEFNHCRSRLVSWREDTFIIESDTCYLGLEDVMTDAALDAIARSKNVDNLDSFDLLKPAWAQRRRWGAELLEVLGGIKNDWAQAKQDKEERTKAAKTKKKAKEKKAREEEQKEEERNAEIARQVEQEMAEASQTARREAEIEGRRRADEIQPYSPPSITPPCPRPSIPKQQAAPSRPMHSVQFNRPLVQNLAENRRQQVAGPSSPLRLAVPAHSGPRVEQSAPSATISRAEALHIISGDTSVNREAILGAAKSMGNKVRVSE
ncbi:DEAD/DEAH box helicase [Ceratobasidium sp. AG-Ba]|nr:DEAD/DEAH box helicase [Ceratobasidium sp. AG-Ba]